MFKYSYPYGQDFPFVEIETSQCSARLSLYGAQLLDWTPKGQFPVLWMSPNAEFVDGKAIRGGVPLCWPWFGKDPTDGGRPSHGVARVSLWSLVSSEVLADGTAVLELALPASRPEDPSARLRLELGQSLEMRLVTENGTMPLPFSAAFHSYFSVSNYARTVVTGLKDCPFTEFAADAVPHRESPLHPAGHIDRIYYPTKTVVHVADLEWQRVLCLTRSGSNSLVVWNPGAELAAGMADVGAGFESGFLCVETVTAPQEEVVLAPGAVHTMICRVAVSGIGC